jgi:hypothetical protein
MVAALQKEGSTTTITIIIAAAAVEGVGEE